MRVCVPISPANRLHDLRFVSASAKRMEEDDELAVKKMPKNGNSREQKDTSHMPSGRHETTLIERLRVVIPRSSSNGDSCCFSELEAAKRVTHESEPRVNPNPEAQGVQTQNQKLSPRIHVLVLHRQGHPYLWLQFRSKEYSTKVHGPAIELH